jgi:hypothetical protein
MKKESGLSKVGAWVAGIAATVISGLLVWYLSQPKPAPPPPPQAVVTTFEGMVYSGDAPVAKALVAVRLTGSAGTNGAIHDITDDNGAYKIELTGLPPGTGARLSVAAKGYKDAGPKILAEPLQSDMRVDVDLRPELIPVESPGKGSGGGGAAAAQPLHPVQPGTHLPIYRPKTASMATKVRIAAKQ